MTMLRQCHLGFHRWAEARNDLGERLLMCVRCGHLRTWHDNDIPFSACSNDSVAVHAQMG